MTAKRSGRNKLRVPTATKPIITAGDNNTPDSTSHAADTRPADEHQARAENQEVTA